MLPPNTLAELLQVGCRVISATRRERGKGIVTRAGLAFPGFRCELIDFKRLTACACTEQVHCRGSDIGLTYVAFKAGNTS